MLYGLDERTASIYAPIHHELSMVDDKLRSLAPAQVGHLRPLLEYVAETGGKRVRPPSPSFLPTPIPTSPPTSCSWPAPWNSFISPP